MSNLDVGQSIGYRHRGPLNSQAVDELTPNISGHCPLAHQCACIKFYSGQYFENSLSTSYSTIRPLEVTFQLPMCVTFWDWVLNQIITKCKQKSTGLYYLKLHSLALSGMRIQFVSRKCVKIKIWTKMSQNILKVNRMGLKIFWNQEISWKFSCLLMHGS